MNILIESHETSEYMNEMGGWSKDPLTAMRFANSRVAFRAARQQTIGKFNIVGHIPTTHQFVNLNHGHGIGMPPAGAGKF
jgi:hypothetical protein